MSAKRYLCKEWTGWLIGLNTAPSHIIPHDYLDSFYRQAGRTPTLTTLLNKSDSKYSSCNGTGKTDIPIPLIGTKEPVLVLSENGRVDFKIN